MTVSGQKNDELDKVKVETVEEIPASAPLTENTSEEEAERPLWWLEIEEETQN